MFKKKAVIVFTAAGTGIKSAMKDVEDCLFYLGVPQIYKCGMAVQAMSWDGVAAEERLELITNRNRILERTRLA